MTWSNSLTDSKERERERERQKLVFNLSENNCCGGYFGLKLLTFKYLEGNVGAFYSVDSG
ncbi:MAG: hypothetical protein MRERV_1c095 [Mycoplasmataceae bacterium RV_VA103A]|nr:MAG: hypothetical protein MRERV_10c015 [Mycoplasmataceae bacterium RV_VA103A]KLL05412.1 MAG: hypothetical protein MRERV_1c095 [Mycoplasmataceae bacterium RV_VA103A]